MTLLRKQAWFLAAAGITLVFAVVSLNAHRSEGLSLFADLVGLALMLAATAATLSNGFQRPKQERSFWLLMALGFALWTSNQAAWTYWENLRRQVVPDPFFFDIPLFFHVVPMIAAVAWRPDLPKKEGRIRFSTLNFLMLLACWLFLYAFIVFPHQYVVPNVHAYNVLYDRLYAVECGLYLAVLSIAAFTSVGGWRRLYLHFVVVGFLYTVNSQFLDRASADNFYYSGSVYDIPLIGAVAWMAAVVWSARHWELKPSPFRPSPRWKKIVPRLAMLAILSFPLLGLWTVLVDDSPTPTRVFRLHVVLAAMLLLGAFVFLKQYLQDQALVDLLQESRRGFESQKKLQTQIVQREKLLSLGTLVAGAAKEIDLPLTAVMNSSEQLWSQERLTDQQNTLVRKIVSHAQRSRDLVASLLRFAQHAPGEKALVDLSALLNRATQIVEWRYSASKIQVKVSVEPRLPRIWGNVNQLFQSFVEVIENAMDALRENPGGGALQISAQRQGQQIVLEFSDNGPGIREPLRVFDPFYTTKPVGKGTGLGLSVVYGVVQDHGGQITCHNKPDGGALFILRFPFATEMVAQAGAGRR